MVVNNMGKTTKIDEIKERIRTRSEPYVIMQYRDPKTGRWCVNPYKDTDNKTLVDMNMDMSRSVMHWRDTLRSIYRKRIKRVKGE